MPIKFIANHNTIIYGSTGVGKTHFMLRVLKERLIHPFPKHVTYLYGVRQDFMNVWNHGDNPEVDFVHGLDFTKVKDESILVIDDLLLSNNKEVAEAFIMGSHHRHISVFYLTQNLFPNDPLFRLMSINCHYFVLFRNPRNQRQVHTLAQQAFTDLAPFKAAYKRISIHPRGFILLNFNPLLPKELTVVTDFWSKYISVFI